MIGGGWLSRPTSQAEISERSLGQSSLEFFLERFFPRYSQDRKYREFVSLVQGDQSVEQYVMRFYDLSKFASHRDERELAMKFVDGLSSRIHMLVAGHYCDTVDKAIAAATSIEAE